MSPKTGWAVVEYGDILVNTVCDTRRGAIVNWLIAEKNLLTLAGVTDNAIEQLWAKHQGDSICTTVNIEVTKR